MYHLESILMEQNNHTEIMLIAQEECAEVTQAISKVFRFGIDGVHNANTNRARLTEEVGDLKCMIDLMCQQGIIDEAQVNAAAEAKLKKLKRWSTIFGMPENY